MLCDILFDPSTACSTPFGITEYIGRGQAAVRQTEMSVLNAFRHHGVYRAETAAVLDRAPVLCSTPFGITEYIGLPPDSNLLPAECSTPFGITEYIGAQVALDLARDLGCSTPFGITEYIGGAQKWDQEVAGLCSTPFGITEYIGLADAYKRPPV